MNFVHLPTFAGVDIVWGTLSCCAALWWVAVYELDQYPTASDAVADWIQAATAAEGDDLTTGTAMPPPPAAPQAELDTDCRSLL